MKHLYVLTALAATGIMLFTTGCCSTPKPVTTITGDVKFTEEVSATVTADQKIVMDGQKFTVADIPEQLARRNVSKEITIIVYPESKITRETFGDMVKVLVKNNYEVSIDASSKYADVPISGR